MPNAPVTPGELLIGEPLGEGALPTDDARTCALRRLKLYLSLLRFTRRGDRGGPPIEFRVPRENVLEEWPDDPKDLRFPALAFTPGNGVHEEFGLGPPRLLEETADVYGRGLALAYSCDYTETFVIEPWAASKAERRALMAGLKTALRSADASYATMFRLPDYFDRIARFWLEESRYVDDSDVARGRRRGGLTVWMQVPEVQLVRYVRIEPRVVVTVREAGEPDACLDGADVRIEADV